MFIASHHHLDRTSRPSPFTSPSLLLHLLFLLHHHLRGRKERGNEGCQESRENRGVIKPLSLYSLTSSLPPSLQSPPKAGGPHRHGTCRQNKCVAPNSPSALPPALLPSLAPSSALDLESSRAPTPTGLLELPPLGPSVRLDIVVRVHVTHRRAMPKVGQCLPIVRPTQQHTISSLGRSQGQLIKRQNLAACLEDTCAGRGRHLKGSNAQLGHLEHARIVGDGPDNDSSLPLLPLHVTDEPGDGDRGTVRLGHKQTLEHHGVEGGVGTTGQEPVELD